VTGEWSLARIATTIAGMAVLAACAMPRTVSSLGEVQASAEQGNILLVPVTVQTLPPPPHALTGSFPASFANAEETDYNKLGPGDRVQVRIWESGTATLFSQAGGGSDLGEMTVDQSGRLYFPYVGAVRVAGMTPAEVRATVARRLSTVVANPQVDVRPIEQRSLLVSVQGDAAKTGSFPIARGRTRLGELLAEVAPNQKNPEVLRVTLRRGSQAGTVRLSDIYADPKLDVALQPGDSVILSNVVENVTILGAAGVQGQVPISKRDFTLIDALGQARGLDSQLADPRAVFVMRAQDDPAAPPMVYQFDMRQPQAIALGNRFVLQDNDAILISNASWAQTRSVLSAFAQSMGTLRSVATIPVP
jgi:polysaccharide export outer membrane protein